MAPKSRVKANAQTVPKRTFTVEQEAAKKLYDNMKGWDAEATDLRKGKNGLTLRKTVIDRLEQWYAAGKPKGWWGNNWWNARRDEYRSAADLDTLLSPDEPVQPISPELMVALSCAGKKPPQRSGLVSYAETARGLNDTEISGIFRCAVTLRPRQKKQLFDALALARSFHEMDVKTAHAETIKLIVPWLDQVFVASLLHNRSKKRCDKNGSQVSATP